MQSTTPSTTPSASRFRSPRTRREARRHASFPLLGSVFASWIVLVSACDQDPIAPVVVPPVETPALAADAPADPAATGSATTASTTPPAGGKPAPESPALGRTPPAPSLGEQGTSTPTAADPAATPPRDPAVTVHLEPNLDLSGIPEGLTLRLHRNEITFHGTRTTGAQPRTFVSHGGWITNETSDRVWEAANLQVSVLPAAGGAPIALNDRNLFGLGRPPTMEPGDSLPFQHVFQLDPEVQPDDVGSVRLALREVRWSPYTPSDDPTPSPVLAELTMGGDAHVTVRQRSTEFVDLSRIERPGHHRTVLEILNRSPRPLAQLQLGWSAGARPNGEAREGTVLVASLLTPPMMPGETRVVQFIAEIPEHADLTWELRSLQWEEP